ncbi:SdpI/YhfL protein family protein [uncultured archaeon]|nr:SdpI/YhfL protein family protein [uncultured archaeon]
MGNTTPKRKGNRLIAVSALMAIVTIIITLCVYSLLPAQMITHWGISGEANGFMPKEFGAWIIPIISIAILALLYYIPRLDPLKENIDKFKSVYHMLIAVVCGFFLYSQLILLAINMDATINMTQLLVPALGVLFVAIGAILPRTKRNYFIGIKTPWTLYSDKVWDDTHRIGGRVFTVAGIIIFLSAFASPNHTFILVFTSIIAAAAIPIAYSYKSFKSLKK